MLKIIRRLLLVIPGLSLALAGCLHDDDETGTMTLAVTDAPVDNATAVVVQFTGVELKPASGAPQVFEFDETREIDLLALQGGGSEIILDEVTLPAGQYNWVRLMVTAERLMMDSYITLEDGSMHSLWIPSGDETGLKLVTPFVVPGIGTADFTIDFDLRKSVHRPDELTGDYILKPALRLIDNTEVGAIAGTVAQTLFTQDCTPAVYVFGGSDATPDDVDAVETEADPVNTARIKLNANNGLYEYRAAFLEAGEYTAALTCDAALDDPETNDTLNFLATQNATVTAGQTTEIDFD